MKKNKKIWSYALAAALAVSNLSVVAAPFTSIVAMAADSLVYDGITFDKAATTIAVGGEVTLNISGTNPKQELTDAQYVEYSIVKSDGVATTSIAADPWDSTTNELDDEATALSDFNTKWSAYKAALTDDSKKEAYLTAKNALKAARNKVAKAAANYVTVEPSSDSKSVTVRGLNAAAADKVVIAATLFNSSDNTFVAESYSVVTVVAEEEPMYFALGTGNYLAATSTFDPVYDSTGLTIGIDPSTTTVGHTVTGEHVDDATIGDLLDKAKAAIRPSDVINATVSAEYSLDDITNVQFYDKAKSTTYAPADVTLDSSGYGTLSVPEIVLTSEGKKLTSSATTNLNVTLTINVGSAKVYKKTQSYPVIVKAPTSFTLKVTSGTTNGTNPRKLDSTDVALNPENAETTATFTVAPASVVDSNDITVVKWTAKRDGADYTFAAAEADKFSVADPTTTWNLGFSAPTSRVDANNKFNLNVVAKHNTTNVFYVANMDFSLAVDNLTLDVDGIPTEMFVEDEYDLSTVTASYGDTSVPAKDITWAISNNDTTQAASTVAKIEKDTIIAQAVGTAYVYPTKAKLDGINTTTAANPADAITAGFPVIKITVSDALTVTLPETTVNVGGTLDLTKATIKSGENVIQEKNVIWELAGVTPSDGEYKNEFASIKGSTLTGIAVGTVEVRAYMGSTAYGAVEVTIVDEISDAIEAAEKAAVEAVADPSEDNIKAAKDAVDAAKVAGATDDQLKAATDKIAQAEAAKKAKDDAIAAASTAADAAVAAPSDDTINAAKAAVEAAKKAGATDTDLKAVTDKIAQAEAAKAAADEAAKKKAEEEAKKSDGSAANTPAPAGTELKDAAGKATGFKVTDANPKAPEVEFTAPADKEAKDITVPDTVKDQSGNEYKVTSIASGAFKDSKAKTVTIGKNIKSIDKNAFKDSKIKTVKVKGTKLTKKMAKAFNKLKKGAKVKVSGSNKKKNKKYLNALKNVKNGKIKVK